MRAIPYVLCSLIIESSLIESSLEIFDISSYKDKKFSRQLGTNCDSIADVTCVFRSTGGFQELPCAGNFRIRKSDCAALNNKVPVPIKITWKYCNTGNNGVQVPIKEPNKVAAKYKNENRIVSKDLPLPNVSPGDCSVYEFTPNLNLCKSGISMSMKYEAKIPTVPNSSCFAFTFLRVRKELIPEDKSKSKKRECAMTSQIRCKIEIGPFKDEHCAGNLEKPTREECDSGPQLTEVRWEYQYCNLSRLPNTSLIFVKDKTFSKLNSDTLNMDKGVLPLGCRTFVEKSTINRCDVDTFAEQKLRARLPNDNADSLLCSKYSELRIKPHQKCDYKFIITEVVHNKPRKGSFFEIYSPNCPGETISEYYQVIKYKGKRQPSVDVIDLKGLTLDENGFLVFCLSSKVSKLYSVGNKKCNVISGAFSPADSEPGDTLAVIKGRVSDKKPFVIVDTFGNAKTGKGPGSLTARRRCSRETSKRNQNYPTWDVAHFICTTFTNKNAANIGINPGQWKGHRITNSPSTEVPMSEVPTHSSTFSLAPSRQWTSTDIVQVGDDLVARRHTNFDKFGSTVSLSLDGHIVAVGSPVSPENRGSVTIFRYDDALNVWKHLGNVVEGTVEDNQFGYRMKLSANGSTVVVGEPFHTNQDGDSIGQIHAFRYDESVEEWKPLGNPIEGKLGPDTEFGTSVTVSSDGRRLVVGAPDHKTTGIAIVYTYDESTNDWTSYELRGGKNIFDKFGHNVDLSSDGTTLAVSSIVANLRGFVVVYKLNSNDKFEEVTRLIPDTIRLNFGWSISLSWNGSHLAVGSPVGMGRVDVYKQDTNDSTYAPLGEPFFGTTNNQNLGYSVLLSEDGLKVAIGSPAIFDSKVEIYRFTNGSWGTGIEILAGDTQNGCGRDVDLASNANYIAFGCPDNIFGSGKVYRLD